MKALLIITGIFFAGSTAIPKDDHRTLVNTEFKQHSSSDSSAPSIQGEAASGPGLSGRATPANEFDFFELPMLPGVAQPSRRVEISPALDGVLSSVAVREGQRVKAGQTLGRLDDSVARASLESARSTAERRGAIEEAKSEAETAKRQVQRLEKIDKIGAVPEVELDEARSRYAKAMAAVMTAQEDATRALRLLELEQARLAQYEVVAPFDGVITYLVAEPGAAQNSQTEFGTLVSLSELFVDLHLPIELFGTLKVGDRRTLQSGAPVHKDLEGTLLSIDPLIDPATRTFRCRFAIPNPDLALPAGFTALLKL